MELLSAFLEMPSYCLWVYLFSNLFNFSGSPRRAEPRTVPEMRPFGVTVHEAARALREQNWVGSDTSGPKLSQELGDGVGEG